MRVIKTYFFYIKTKIVFSEWPLIVHRFFNECGVHYSRFMYYFEDLLRYTEPAGYLPDRSGCAKILKDLPKLGQVRFHNYQNYGMSNSCWLSNIDGENGVSESDILPLMKKIHRRYGFTNCALYYYDVDFFGHNNSFERDFVHAERMCRDRGMDFDTSMLIDQQPYGSGVVLHRDICGDNYLTLSIDIMHDGKIYDPEPYFEKMKEFLPNVQYKESMKVYLTDGQKLRIQEVNRKASSVIQQACDYLDNLLIGRERQNSFTSKYALAPKLKKLTKMYGYKYKKESDNFSFCAEKRTEKGNILNINVVTGPSHNDLCFIVLFQGLGFSHKLCCKRQTPTNQQEADICLENLFRVLMNFEADILTKLDEYFPSTPDWFLPGLW